MIDNSKTIPVKNAYFRAVLQQSLDLCITLNLNKLTHNETAGCMVAGGFNSGVIYKHEHS